MDELRIQIWDLLFRAREPKSIDAIADSTDQDTKTILAAVDHEWFTVNQDCVTISIGTGKA